MSKPETLIVKKIMRRLEAEGGFWFKVHGGLFQLSGIPDIVGCYKGWFIGIEVKVPGGRPTKLQELRIKTIKDCGGRCGIATDVDEALSIRNGSV